MTTSLSKSDSASSETQSDIQARLDRFESICKRIWPFIRFWGLCGASEEALEVMLDLGEAIRESPETAVLSAHIESREATVQQVAYWLEDHRYTGRKIGRSAMEQLVLELRQTEFPVA